MHIKALPYFHAGGMGSLQHLLLFNRVMSQKLDRKPVKGQFPIEHFEDKCICVYHFDREKV